MLRELFEVETALPQVSTRRLTELAAEIRQTEATIAKLVGQLVPDPNVVAPPKSRQHQRAAMARWHRNARWIRQNPNGDLRKALLAEAREMLCNVIGFDSYIDDLAKGEPVRLYRWELPFDRPGRAVGGLQDDLILGDDDVPRPASATVSRSMSDQRSRPSLAP